MRVLFYAINGRGMGHLNRTLVLARSLRAAAPEVDIQFVVDSPHFGLVQDAGFAVSKFPDRSHDLGYHRGRAERYDRLPAMFDILLRRFAPDVMIVDFLCKRALFEQIKARGVRLAAVLRKQSSAALRMLALNRGASLVDTWLLPHSPDDWGLAGLPRSFRSRAVHLGAVSRGLDVERIPEVRAGFGVEAGTPLVIVTIGGGGAAESKATLDAAEDAMVGSGRTARLVMVYGPSYRGTIPDGGVFGGLTIVRRRFIADLPEAMAAADLVICNVGYNTALELRAAGSPALVVPLVSPGRDDQGARAQALVDEGRALRVEAEPQAMIAAIASVLDGDACLRRPPTGGEDPSVKGRLLLAAIGS